MIFVGNYCLFENKSLISMLVSPNRPGFVLVSNTFEDEI